MFPGSSSVTDQQMAQSLEYLKYLASRREIYANNIHARLDKDSFMAILQKAILIVNTVNRLESII